MSPVIRQQLETLGRDLSPELLGGTIRIFSELNAGIDPATEITRDIAYGGDPRQRLDIFRQEGVSGAPVLIYLHGGGFVMGDKHTEGSPFYSNIGDFAARSGMVGITMTYRLAPANQFPSGPEDLALAIEWVRANIVQYGGDPGKIVLVGQSAGAVHVAGYIAHRRFHVVEGGGVAGAVMLSGIYDTLSCVANPSHTAYYGDDRKGWGAASCMAGLLNSKVLQLYTVCEFDPADYQEQAARLVGAWGVAKGSYPEIHRLSGHNHLSPALSIGSPEKEVERMIAGFAKRVTREG